MTVYARTIRLEMQIVRVPTLTMYPGSTDTDVLFSRRAGASISSYSSIHDIRVRNSVCPHRSCPYCSTLSTCQICQRTDTVHPLNIISKCQPLTAHSMVRIILMPPVFAVSAVCQIYFYHKSFYPELFTSAFETIAVVSYFKLVNREFIPKEASRSDNDPRDDDDLSRLDLKEQCKRLNVRPHKWVFPCCCCCRPKTGAAQYGWIAFLIYLWVWVQFLGSIIAAVTQHAFHPSLYCEGHWSYHFTYPYVSCAILDWVKYMLTTL